MFPLSVRFWSAPKVPANTLQWSLLLISIVSTSALSLLLACVQCSTQSDLVPTYATVGMLALSVLASLGHALNSCRSQPLQWPVAINVLQLSALPIVVLASGLANVRPCTYCLVFWVSLALQLTVHSVRIPLLKAHLIVVALTSFLVFSLTAETAAGSGVRRRYLSAGLTSLQFKLSATKPTISQLGLDRLNHHLDEGAIVYMTACSVCTRRSVGKILSNLRLSQRYVLLVSPDSSPRWQAPAGYETSRRVIDSSAWERSGVRENASPLVVTIHRSTAKEILP